MPQQGSWLQEMDSFQLPDPPLIKTQKEHTHSLPHRNSQWKSKEKNVSVSKTRLHFSLHGLFFLLQW